MKKLFLIITALVAITATIPAQSSLDIIKEINKETYRSLKEDPRNNSESFEGFNKKSQGEKKEFEQKSKEVRESFENSFNEFRKESDNSKKIIDLEVENNKLKMGIHDLERGLEYKDEIIAEKDKELLKLKIRYNVLSKSLYFMINYKCTPYELSDYFTEEEFRIINELPKEWRRKYNE